MRFNGRLGTGVLATSLMAAGMFAVCAVAVPGTASARCAGEGNRIPSDYYYGGVRRVAETPISGTCNGNSDYQAVLQDVYSDGRFVSVQFRDAGYDWRRIADTTSSEEYRYFDLNSNSNADMRLCVEGLGCGWGTDQGGYGLNHGF